VDREWKGEKMRRPEEYVRKTERKKHSREKKFRNSLLKERTARDEGRNQAKQESLEGKSRRGLCGNALGQEKDSPPGQ